MVEMDSLFRLCPSTFALIFRITLSVPAMLYDEPDYSIVKKTGIYEVRFYKKRTVA